MTTKKWNQPKGKQDNAPTSPYTHTTRMYTGFKSNKEMQEYIKKHNLKPDGCGYNEKYKHFFHIIY